MAVLTATAVIQYDLSILVILSIPFELTNSFESESYQANVSPDVEFSWTPTGDSLRGSLRLRGIDRSVRNNHHHSVVADGSVVAGRSPVAEVYTPPATATKPILE